MIYFIKTTSNQLISFYENKISSSVLFYKFFFFLNPKLINKSYFNLNLSKFFFFNSFFFSIKILNVKIFKFLYKYVYFLFMFFNNSN